jgi:predicted transcriptional regulator
MSKKRVNVHVGSIKDMGRRFIHAWRQVEQGKRVREEHLTFADLSILLNALSPKRLELLREVHREPARSIRALAERLKRDYKRVHEDVETLVS